jgi:hypothetical protein
MGREFNSKLLCFSYREPHPMDVYITIVAVLRRLRKPVFH